MKNKLLNIYKLKKLFKRGLTPLLSALTVFNFCAVNVNAATTKVYVDVTEPFVSDKTGYFYIMDSAGVLYIYVWAFNDAIYGYNNSGSGVTSGQFYDYLYLDFNDDEATLSFRVCNSGYFTLYEYNKQHGNYRIVYNEFLSVVEGNTLDSVSVYGPSGRKITHFNYKGNLMWHDSRSEIVSNEIELIWSDKIDTNALLTNMNTLISNQYVTNDNLNTMISQNTTINNSITSGNNWLKNIFNRLGDLIDAQSEDSVQDVSSSGITSVENKENALVGSNVSTNELNVSINPNAASVVWTLIDDLVTSNAKVFAMFISILTIGVIGLILNR